MPYTPRATIREFVAPPPTISGIPLDADWRVLLPALADATNLWANPSWELNTTGANAVGGTIARTTSKQRRGAYSLQVSPTAGLNDGVFLDRFSVSAGLPYTHGFDFWAPGGVPYQAYVADVSGGKFTPAFTFTGKGYWERLYFRRPEILTTSRRLYITKNNTANVQPFYLDGVSIIQTLYPFSYFDGDSVGFVPGRQDFYWTGTPHGSTSVMIAQSRAGGRILSLSTYGFMLLAMLGLGMGPLTNVSIPLALVGGDQYQRTVKGSRTFSLLGTLSHSSPIRFQNNFAALVAAFAPDAVGDQPTVLQYQPLNTCGKPDGETLEIVCKYAGGLEGKRDNPYQEDLDLKFTTYFPFVARLDGSEGGTLSGSSTLASSYMLQRSVAGAWSAPGSGPNGPVFAMVRLPNGTIVVGGQFTSAGGVANTGQIALWSPGTQAWSALGTGGPGGAVYVNALAVDAAGILYAGGNFGSMGGKANTRFIAKWDGAVWSSIGTTTGGTVGILALCVDIFGQVWAGGDFTTIGGMASANLALWDGAAWSVPVSFTGQPNSTVHAITTIPGSQDLIVGGEFTLIGGVTVAGIALIPDASLTAISAMGGGATGANPTIYTLLYAPDGTLYAGGPFAGMSGVASTAAIAAWNGVQWAALSTGLVQGGGSPNVYALAYDPQTKSLWVGGSFTKAGNLTMPGLGGAARWNGTSWYYLDTAPATAATIQSILIPGNGSAYLGGNSSVTWLSGGSTVVTNSGSAAAYPVIVIAHPTTAAKVAALFPIRNYTTGEVINLNLSLQIGETLTIDLRPGRKTITSDFRGNLFSALLPGSQLATWHLQPGANTISVLATVASGNPPALTMAWTPVYNALESAVR